MLAAGDASDIGSLCLYGRQLSHLAMASISHLEQNDHNLEAQTFTLSEIKLLLVALLFYVHGKHLRSCRDDQLT